MTQTYLHCCLKDGLTIRWPETAMPINVYIAPFRWYEKQKQQESNVYNGLVMEALDTWNKISGEMVRFRLVSRLQDSQIDINWRRVDRKSLGHCEYMVNDKSMIYSAEIKIGISDGLVHAQYNDIGEVKHTVLHEIGHALGLGHSDQAGDIMYVPHQYGSVDLSQRDGETLRWLYKLPVAFNYLAVGKKYELAEPFHMQDVIDHISGNKKKPQQAFKVEPPKEQPGKLLDQHQILSEMGKFYLSTQNIKLSEEDRKRLLQKRLLQPPEDPSK